METISLRRGGFSYIKLNPLKAMNLNKIRWNYKMLNPVFGRVASLINS